MARHVIKAKRAPGQAKCKWCGGSRYGGQDCPVTEQMRLALFRFMRKNGRSWKSVLDQCWQTGNYGHAVIEDDNDVAHLQKFRNSVGPSRLSKITGTFLEDRFDRENGFKVLPQKESDDAHSEAAGSGDEACSSGDEHV